MVIVGNGKDINISNDSKSQEILTKASNYINDIKAADMRKKLDVEKTFYKHFAFLPTRLSSGKWIFFKTYYARYHAKAVSYIKIMGTGIEVTDVRRHYIDKEFVPDYNKPIEKV